jgi:hypothetical protein
MIGINESRVIKSELASGSRAISLINKGGERYKRCVQSISENFDGTGLGGSPSSSLLKSTIEAGALAAKDISMGESQL